MRWMAAGCPSHQEAYLSTLWAWRKEVLLGGNAGHGESQHFGNTSH